MSERHKAWDALKSVLSGLIGYQCEKVSVRGSIVATLCVAQTRGMKSGERRSVNVLELEYLASSSGRLQDRLLSQFPARCWLAICS